MNAIVPAAQAERPNLFAGARPTAIVPQSLDEVYRLAKAVVMAGMAPKGMETVEKCTVAMLRGLEIGLSPMQAIDKIAIVGNRPTIWGDAVIGLVRASGLCEYVRETAEGEGDAHEARCETLRRGEPEPVIGTFSVADAKRASLWGKSGPWVQYPARMLRMRARAFALRDAYADVLGGLYIKEELDEEERPARRAASVPAPREQRALPATERAPIAVNDAPVDPPHDDETGEITASPDFAILSEAAEVAADGIQTYQRWFGGLKRAQQKRLVETGEHERNKVTAAEADAAAVAQDEMAGAP